MTEQKKAELDLLNDTINYYTINNRGYDGGSCRYLVENTGTKCAK